MEFKINSKTRIKIPSSKLAEMYRERESDFRFFYEFMMWFNNESGLRKTSNRSNRRKNGSIYYFQVLDKNKYLLAKIKYGI